jgi:hypothetical protein
MHIYLRLVGESGEVSVEQSIEEGVHSVEVGPEGCVADFSDNPDTAGKLRSISPLLYVL